MRAESGAVHINAESLYDSLPSEVRRSLSEIGITSVDYGQMSELDFGRVLEKMISMLNAGSHTAFLGMSVCMGIMLMCSMAEGFNVTLGERTLKSVSNAVGTMCICTAVIVPLCSTIERAVEVLNGVSGFMVLLVPIMAGLVISSGKEMTGTSYYTMMMTAGNAVSTVSAKLVSPLMNVFLALTVTSSLSVKMNISSLCESVYKTAKWALTFIMGIFTAVLSLQTIMTSSMDNVSKKALRFAVSSFVPVVGGALGEALNTFNGSVELLKTGAGVFVIIAGGLIIMPVALECIVWQFSMFVLSGAGDIMGLSEMTKIFRSISKAVAVMTGLLFCALAVLVISTGIILLTGR